MNGKILGPNAMSVPVGISILGLELPNGAGPLSLRQLYVGLALHALLGRESSTVLGVETLARLAVASADAALTGLAVPRQGGSDEPKTVP